MTHRSSRLAGLAGATVALLSSQGLAQRDPPSSIAATAGQLTAPAGGGQGSLTVAIMTLAGAPTLTACGKATCAEADFKALSFPVAPSAGAEVGKARLSSLAVGQGRHVIRIEVAERGKGWEALVAAPLAAGAEPRVLWSASIPDVAGGEAESGAKLEVAEGEGGTVKVLVGEVRRELSLCGRPTLLSPRMVDPSDLTLKAVKMQRLSREERARAEQIAATRLATPSPAPLSRLLVATGASSALGSPSALTDSHHNTAWSEARGGEGRGEFVAMRAPSEVPIVAFSLVIRPDNREISGGTSPRKFFLATDDRLIEVTMPEDGWSTAGAHYEVRPAAPIRTSCVALVLDEAFASKDPKNDAVTVTEIAALSEFDGQTDLAGLVGALAGGGARAQSAAAVLMRGGQVAHKAVAVGYDKLDDGGKLLAMGVIDAAPCNSSSPFFAPRLASSHAPEREHARDRIRRCARASAPALIDVMSSGSPKQKWAAADELSAIDPAAAVSRLGPMLATADAATRAAIRGLIARATGQPRSMSSVGRLLDDSTFPPVASIDLLRAASAHLEGVALPAGAAFSRLSQGQLDTRTRFLLCEPAARLAKRGDARALGFLYERVLRDPEPMVRARAAGVSGAVGAMHPYLMTALEDENVRVRDAATASLAASDAASSYLVRRLMIDPWPAVRARAADSLGRTGKSSQADKALTDALVSDSVASVRSRVATALGARGVLGAAPALRERADDAAEELNVRVKAVHAIGRVCDRSSIDMLTVLARRAADPFASETAGEMGIAAVAALGRLHPTDLPSRLEPVVKGQRTPRHVRAAANAAVRETDICR